MSFSHSSGQLPSRVALIVTHMVTKWLTVLLCGSLRCDGLLDAYRGIRSRDKISGPAGRRSENRHFGVVLAGLKEIYRYMRIKKMFHWSQMELKRLVIGV